MKTDCIIINQLDLTFVKKIMMRALASNWELNPTPSGDISQIQHFIGFVRP
jgi:hypothetical protein